MMLSLHPQKSVITGNSFLFKLEYNVLTKLNINVHYFCFLGYRNQNVLTIYFYNCDLVPVDAVFDLVYFHVRECPAWSFFNKDEKVNRNDICFFDSLFLMIIRLYQ